jgi:hypothetical protein
MAACHLSGRRHSGGIRFPVIWQLQARRREAQTKAAHAQGKQARQEAKLAKEERKALGTETEAQAAQAGQDKWYEQKTVGGAISAALRASAAKKTAAEYRRDHVPGSKEYTEAHAAEPDVEELAARMRKLTALHEAGVLTDAEFETRRQELIEAPS